MAELATKLVPRTWPRVPSIAAVVLAAAVAAPYVRAVEFRGEALPGTTVAGVELAGRDRAEAVAAVRSAIAPKLHRPVVVRAGSIDLRIEPGDLLALDAVSTAEAALAASRRTEPARIAALVGLRGQEVEPVLVVRREGLARTVARVRAAGGRPARTSAVTMDGLDPVVAPSRVGLFLDRVALLEGIGRAALEGGTVTARFTEAEPTINTADATRAAEVARDLLRAPVYVFFDGRPLRTLAPAELARLLSFEERGSRFLVTFDAERLARVLHRAIAPHERPAEDARFRIEGERVQVVPDRPGIGLDVETAVAQVAAAAYAPDRRIAELRVTEVAADVTASELRALGITERISTFTTDMGVSSSNRIWNVQLMARYIDGTIIRPGETFSFNEVVGERTAERGFREGQMIVGSILLPSIGGGVCQTATTLFNNAFELGLPIVRRYNHSFYISHYPLGRDATVSWGGPDLVFRNDLTSALLIESSYTNETLTFTFYGAPTNRRVVASTSPQSNWRAPQTSYAYDPYAPRGSIRSSSGGHQSGFDVTVRRTVYERGQVLRKDSFTSRYIPVGPTLIYGPGTSPPRIDFTLPPPE
jgi:vancomycin resistance protein YoaR